MGSYSMLCNISQMEISNGDEIYFYLHKDGVLYSPLFKGEYNDYGSFENESIIAKNYMGQFEEDSPFFRKENVQYKLGMVSKTALDYLYINSNFNFNKFVEMNEEYTTSRDVRKVLTEDIDYCFIFDTYDGDVQDLYVNFDNLVKFALLSNGIKMNLETRTFGQFNEFHEMIAKKVQKHNMEYIVKMNDW